MTVHIETLGKFEKFSYIVGMEINSRDKCFVWQFLWSITLIY
jgi:hypothetical protein